MSHGNNDIQVERAISKATKGMGVFFLVLSVLSAGGSAWLRYGVAATWTAFIEGILLLFAIFFFYGFFRTRKLERQFRKYAIFYNRGDVFLDEIARETNEKNAGKVMKDLVSAAQHRLLKQVIIYEETGQVVAVFGNKRVQAGHFKRYMPYFNEEAVCMFEISVYTNTPYEEISVELESLREFGAIETPIFDEENKTVTIRTISPEQKIKEVGHEEVDALLQEGRQALVAFGQLQKTISDEEIREKIGQMIVITRAILQKVSEEPKSYRLVRRFGNYYLPKSIKLLETYEKLQNSKAQSEKISGTAERISQALDPLIGGFQNIYDSLYRSQTFDIEADLEVLELMLKQDNIYDKKDEPIGKA